MNQLLFRGDKSKPADLDSIYAGARTVHLVFLGSTIIYVIVGLLIRSFLTEAASGLAVLTGPAYAVSLAIVSAVSVVLASLVLVVLPRRATAQDPLTGPRVRSLVELGQVLSTRHLIRVSLSQAIALLGFVLFLLSGSLLALLLFPGITFALLLVVYPRREQWDEARWRAEESGALKAVE